MKLKVTGFILLVLVLAVPTVSAQSSAEVTWNGTVTLSQENFSVSINDETYGIDNLTALGALNAASKDNFSYKVSDEWYDSYGSFLVTSVDGMENKNSSGWSYWVNYPWESMPMVGANNYKVKDGDTVYWYYMGDTPENASNVIKIRTNIELQIGNHQPQDLDDNGLYEDIDGDSSFNFGDIAFFFQNFDSSAVKNNHQYYDFNGDGNINFGDVIALFQDL